MGSSPKVPTMQDPNQVASQQQAYNVSAGQQSQAGSMVNQNNAFGSANYAQTGTDQYGNPTYTLNTQYNAPTQALFNQGQAGAGALAGTLPGYAGAANQNLGLAGNTANQSNALINQGENMIAGANYNPATVGANTQGLTNQMMSGELASLAPTFNMQNNQTRTDLENRGLMPGTTAYDNQMRQVQLNQGQTMAGAAAQFEPQAYNQAQQMYQLPLTVGTSMVNSGQGLGQLGQGYSSTGYGAAGAGATALGAAQGWTPGMASTMAQTPGLSVNPADLTGAVGNYQNAEMQALQAQQSGQNAMYSALGGIGGAALGAAGNIWKCDQNLKTDRRPVAGEKILRKLRKVKAQHFRYTDEAQAWGCPAGERIGPMAQDWAAQFGGETTSIDLTQAMGVLLAAVQALDERTKHLAAEVG